MTTIKLPKDSTSKEYVNLALKLELKVIKQLEKNKKRSLKKGKTK